MTFRIVRPLPSLTLLLLAGVAAAEEPKSAPPKVELTPEAQAAADELTKTLPADSEAKRMLDDILKGAQLGPTDGWFALSKSASRYSWPTLSARFDADKDGRITREELKLGEKDFARIDRDSDGSLSERDLDWSEPTMGRSPANFVFGRSDLDGNGKVTAEEFQQLFEQLGGGADGYLSLDEIREQLQPAAPAPAAKPAAAAATTPAAAPSSRPADTPSPSTLVLGLQRQEIGSLQPGPAVESVAPDFTLKSLTGDEVTLSREVGDKPVVLIFGNFTCGPFRSQAGNIEKFARRYEGRAKIFLVYVREAHPQDGWWMNSNRKIGIDPKQPQSNDERREIAQTCQRHLDLDVPFLVDNTDDKVGAQYSGMPNRLYLIDRQGKIAFKNARGPFGFKLRELEQSLVLLLKETEAGKDVAGTPGS